jgi:uncharacterized protein YcgI (DUF1989 family)
MEQVRQSHQVAAGSGHGFEVKHGDLVRIIDLEGAQPVDFWAFNRRDFLEFLSCQHTRPAIMKLGPGIGESAYTNRRWPIVTVVADHSPGQHDMLFAACDAARFKQLGHKGPHANCQDNLHAALRELGIALDFTPQPWNLFTNNIIGPDGTFVQAAPDTRPGDSIVLKAEFDVYIVVSACPQDLTGSCGERATDIRVEIVH